MTLDDLRRLAVTRTLFPPTTLKRALHRLGFVQADPIRAPARAQDLILRHRVDGYRAGDLEKRYAALGIEEDFFVNYGFVTRALHTLMHPRPDATVPADGGRLWSAARRKRAMALLEFVRARGTVHPREVDEHFAHGTVKNYWGGSSNATTFLLDAMHYRGLLRIARRDAGIRIYAPRAPTPDPVDEAGAKRKPKSPTVDPSERIRRLDALADCILGIYSPVPARSLSFFLRRLRFAVPQWRADLTATIRRVRERAAHAQIDGTDWYWLPEEKGAARAIDDQVRLLAPFDPVVQDRTRFELLWGWVYRFEAYTPAAKRKLGYYALPLLWQGRVIGWGNLALKDGTLNADLGYVAGSAPRGSAFTRALEEELARMRLFLGCDPAH